MAPLRPVSARAGTRTVISMSGIPTVGRAVERGLQIGDAKHEP